MPSSQAPGPSEEMRSRIGVEEVLQNVWVKSEKEAWKWATGRPAKLLRLSRWRGGGFPFGFL